MKDNTILKIVAVAGLTAIEVTALYMNRDGAILGAVVAAIAGIVGYAVGAKK